MNYNRNFDPKTKSRGFAWDFYDIDHIQEVIDILNEDFMSFCYIIHDKDVGVKVHAHFMIDYGNNTTLKHIKTQYGNLAANGYIKPIWKGEGMYRYFYHDQTIEKAKGKFEYKESDIKCFNGFDPNNLRTYTESEKMIFMDEIRRIIKDNKIIYYSRLLDYLGKEERELYSFAMNNTILITNYVKSFKDSCRSETFLITKNA